MCAGFLLMALAILAAPGILKLILSVFFSAFTLTGLGTAKGLEDRDQNLLEMAYVFFIPDKSRITYIDLPACRDKLVLSAISLRQAVLPVSPIRSQQAFSSLLWRP